MYVYDMYCHIHVYIICLTLKSAYLISVTINEGIMNSTIVLNTSIVCTSIYIRLLSKCLMFPDIFAETKY